MFSGHPTDPNFNPRPYDFLNLFCFIIIFLRKKNTEGALLYRTDARVSVSVTASCQHGPCSVCVTRYFIKTMPAQEKKIKDNNFLGYPSTMTVTDIFHDEHPPVY
jgi:hypothetical protein